MNAIVKFLAPTTLALAAVAAHAGTIETDYPANVPAVQSQAGSASALRAGYLVQPVSEAPVRFSTDDQAVSPRSRDAVRKEAQQPRKPGEQPIA